MCITSKDQLCLYIQITYHNINSIRVVLLPFGHHLLKFFPDPFEFNKIGTVAANIIAERTEANGSSEVQVSYYIKKQTSVNWIYPFS